MIYKNVYFHRMLIYKQKVITDKQKKSHQTQKEYKDIKMLDQKIQYIIDNKLNNNSIRIDPSGKDTIEFLNVTGEFIYARIGRTKDILSVQLRNNKTLEPSPVDKSAEQDLEIFTYLLIDRKEYIISFLKEQSAPSIQSIAGIINNNFGESEDLFAEISSVTIDDAIPILASKEIIGTINYKLSIPSDEKISIDRLGLSEKQFEMLSNQKSVDIEVKLVASRNKDALTDKSKVKQFFEKILKLTDKVSVKAKDSDEYTQTYNIIDSAFTKRTKFNFDRGSNNIEKEIEKELLNVFRTNKEDILQYIK